ncbi:carbamoyl phosphate synthase large subunit, partial [bacterium]|nr:carbamoyl phosphate synthase large subunit [bacterium]
LPMEGAVLITVTDPDKPGVLEVVRRFVELGFTVRATKGTQKYLADHGIQAQPIMKMHEGRPNITDAIKNQEIQLVVNTPGGKLSATDDSYIRKAAIRCKVPYITTIAAAIAAAKGIAACRQGRGEVKSLQEYHADIS